MRHPLDACSKVHAPYRELTLWPGLSKVVTEEEPCTKFEGTSVVLSLPVHVVNASSRPRVLPAKMVLGHVHSKPRLTGCDTYLLKDQYVDFLEGAFKFKKSEFTEVFALDTDYEETTWTRRKVWVNPPWKLCPNAVEKLVKDCPAEFVMLNI